MENVTFSHCGVAPPLHSPNYQTTPPHPTKPLNSSHLPPPTISTPTQIPPLSTQTTAFSITTPAIFNTTTQFTISIIENSNYHQLYYLTNTIIQFRHSPPQKILFSIFYLTIVCTSKTLL